MNASLLYNLYYNYSHKKETIMEKRLPLPAVAPEIVSKMIVSRLPFAPRLFASAHTPLP